MEFGGAAKAVLAAGLAVDQALSLCLQDVSVYRRLSHTFADFSSTSSDFRQWRVGSRPWLVSFVFPYLSYLVFNRNLPLLRAWFETPLTVENYVFHPLLLPLSSLQVSRSGDLFPVNYLEPLFKSLVGIRPPISIKQPISFLALLKLHYGFHIAMQQVTVLREIKYLAPKPVN